MTPHAGRGDIKSFCVLVVITGIFLLGFLFGRGEPTKTFYEYARPHTHAIR
jgi:hypothetical protein